DEINLLVGVPHLQGNERTKAIAVRNALAPLGILQGNAVFGKGLSKDFGILPEHDVVVFSVVERRNLGDADQAIQSPKARSRVAALIGEIPRSTPQPAG